MSTQSRKHRGYRTQKVVAEWFAANGWPFAESTGAARQGADLTGTPDLAIEVKARTGFDPLAWIRQAEKSADGRVPFVVFRCNGQGERVGDYPALIRTRDLVALLRQAGYGDSSPRHESAVVVEPPDPAGELGTVAGVEERRVRLAEQQGDLLALAIRRILEAFGLADDPRVATIVPGVLREIGAGR